VIGGPVTFASVFGTGNPNGQWQIFIRDDGASTFGPSSSEFAPLSNQIAGGWGLQFNTPTAAGVSVSGRVLSPEGRGITNAVITVSGNSLAQPISILTGRNGRYTLQGLTAGETYVVTVASRRFQFDMPSRVVTLNDNLADLDFVGNSSQ
jgi:glutamate synthase domain-containing protein 3